MESNPVKELLIKLDGRMAFGEAPRRQGDRALARFERRPDVLAQIGPARARSRSRSRAISSQVSPSIRPLDADGIQTGPRDLGLDGSVVHSKGSSIVPAEGKTKRSPRRADVRIEELRELGAEHVPGLGPGRGDGRRVFRAYYRSGNRATARSEGLRAWDRRNGRSSRSGGARRGMRGYGRRRGRSRSRGLTRGRRRGGPAVCSGRGRGAPTRSGRMCCTSYSQARELAAAGGDGSEAEPRRS